jgi:hypothetical protein
MICSPSVARGVVLAPAIALALAGCGSSSNTGLSHADGARLHADIAAVRAAASRHDAQQAALSLIAFRRQVTRLAAQHKLTSAQSASLLAGAQQAQARVALDVKPAAPAASTAPATTTPATSSTPAAPAAPAGKGPGHGHGKHGKGEGDGGD